MTVHAVVMVLALLAVVSATRFPTRSSASVAVSVPSFSFSGVATAAQRPGSTVFRPGATQQTLGSVVAVASRTESLDVRAVGGDASLHLIPGAGHIAPMLAYAEQIRAEVSHSAEDFDRVMRWGWGWGEGPFELADLLKTSPKPFYIGKTQLANDGETYVPLANEPQFRTWADFPLLLQTETLDIRDLEGGVAGIGIRTKMGTITPELVRELTDAVAGEGPFVLYGAGRAFSVGYDLRTFLALIEAGEIDGVERLLIELQDLGDLLDTKNIVAAVHGYCLGAGLELAASCSRIVADSEAKIGLPEARVGLLPGGRGTALMRLRAQASNAAMVGMVSDLAQGLISDNAIHARQMGVLAAGDLTEFHPDRLPEAA
ncbi:MAG: hypothetical protein C4321_07570, partial [Chloroflexota bacterium]